MITAILFFSLFHAVSAMASSPREAALRGFALVERVARSGELGFVAAPGTLSLGTPMQVFTVSLRDLQASNPGHDRADHIVKPTDSFHFPLRHEGVEKAMLGVERRQGAWKVTQVGNPETAMRLGKARAAIGARLGIAPEAFFVVRIPALSQTFLAYKNIFMIFVPIVAQSDLGFVPETSVVAEDALRRLLTMAQRLPR